MSTKTKKRTAKTTAKRPQADAMAATFNVKSIHLKRMLEVCWPCVDSETSRYALGGVRLIFESQSLYAVATDGRKLVVFTMPIEHVSVALVGKELTFDLTAIWRERGKLSTKQHQNVVVSVFGRLTSAETQLWFAFKSVGRRSNYDIGPCKEVAGRFPNWREVIPQTHNANASFEFSPTVWSENWKQHNENTGMELSVNGSARWRSECPPLPIKNKLGKVEFSPLLRPDWLMQHVDAIDTGEEKQLAKLYYFGDDNAILISSDFAKYVIMPLARNSRG